MASRFRIIKAEPWRQGVVVKSDQNMNRLTISAHRTAFQTPLLHQRLQPNQLNSSPKSSHHLQQPTDSLTFQRPPPFHSTLKQQCNFWMCCRQSRRGFPSSRISLPPGNFIGRSECNVELYHSLDRKARDPSAGYISNTVSTAHGRWCRNSLVPKHVISLTRH